MVDDSSPSLDLVFHALADRTRRQILVVLRESGELCVGDLAKAFDISLNGVSKHVKVLERASLVSRRVEGRTHWLAARFDTLDVAGGWLDNHRHYWSARLDALGGAVETSSEEE